MSYLKNCCLIQGYETLCSRHFVALVLTLRSFHFEIIFSIWYEVRVQIYSFCIWIFIYPSFWQKTVLSPLNCLNAFAETQLISYMGSFLNSQFYHRYLCLSLFHYQTVLIIVALLYFWNWEVWDHQISFFLQYCFG